MRIGIVCYPTYGGSGAVATELGLALAERGHEVHFISYAMPFRLRFNERVTFHEVEVGSYPLFEHPPYSLALAVKLHEVAVRERLDVIHAHYAIPHATAGWMAKKLLEGTRELPIVTTLHGTDITLVGQDPSYFAITRFSIEKSDAVTAVSAYLRDETYRAFGCDSCAIRVVPNFVDLEEFKPPTERCSSFAPEERILMHISNMRPVKRVLDVVRVFALVQKEVPSRLIMVGDGPDRDLAEREAQRLGVAGRTRFLGKIEDVAEVLQWAHLYLLPSQTESFGLSALEALATGVPVIGSRAGGLPEVVEHGVSGLLAEPGNVDAMAAGALEILCDEARWKEWSAAARQRAAAFATDLVVPQYEEVYAAVVAG
ncbi:MAG TPA: N-acetyl-alpha-D-glucosaminyl L-malate synthase BshA [Gemmatimonadales bacterium]|nr:N-acetyl-alpha-D-glucosaminyl L-malate synthase BshA [Gemmatimonadales bacterium]